MLIYVVEVLLRHTMKINSLSREVRRLSGLIERLIETQSPAEAAEATDEMVPEPIQPVEAFLKFKDCIKKDQQNRRRLVISFSSYKK